MASGGGSTNSQSYPPPSSSEHRQFAKIHFEVGRLQVQHLTGKYIRVATYALLPAIRTMTSALHARNRSILFPSACTRSEGYCSCRVCVCQSTQSNTLLSAYTWKTPGRRATNDVHVKIIGDFLLATSHFKSYIVYTKKLHLLCDW